MESVTSSIKHYELIWLHLLSMLKRLVSWKSLRTSPRELLYLACTAQLMALVSTCKVVSTFLFCCCTHATICPCTFTCWRSQTGRPAILITLSFSLPRRLLLFWRCLILENSCHLSIKQLLTLRGTGLLEVSSVSMIPLYRLLLLMLLVVTSLGI
jgi:hypothetical protein